MISKWILLIALIFLAFWLVKRFQRAARQPPRSEQKVIEDMVRCAYCDVHLPKSESVAGHGQYFCSEAHRALHARAASKEK
ncbi:MAG TPA: PP0621 family protein [Nitrosomonas halophila]|nr:PP0621 family protein [Nitrosomonas halophila]